MLLVNKTAVRVLLPILGAVSMVAAAFANPGDLDPTFGQGGTTTVSIPGTSTTEAGNAVVIQPDGKAVVVGTADSKIAILRLNPDGTLDMSFGFGGKVASSVGYEGDGVALQQDGKIIVAGIAGTGRFMVARFLANGDLDTTFGTLGSTTVTFGNPNGLTQALAVAIQTDGKIVAVGRAAEPSPENTNFGVVRLNADGSLDSTFGNGGKVSTNFPGPNGTFDLANAVTIQADGKILVAGVTNSTSIGDTFAVARYLTNGTLDSTFGTNGLVTFTYGTRDTAAYAIALQSSGKIIVGGQTEGTDMNGVAGGFTLGRLNADGTVDTSFGNNSGTEGVIIIGSVENDARGMVVYSDDSILLVGSVQLSGQSLDYQRVAFDATGAFIGGTRSSADFSASYREEGRAVAKKIGSNNVVIVGVTNQNDSGDIGVVGLNGVKSFGQFPVAVGGSASTVALQSDGRIVAVGSSGQFPVQAITVARLNADGTRDTSFANGGVATVSLDGQDTGGGVAIQSDGKVVVCGVRDNTSSTAYKCVLLRFTAPGALDPTFGTGGVATFDTTPGSNFEVLYRVRIQSDGKIVAVGTSNGAMLALRVLSDGTLDPSFGTNGLTTVNVGNTGSSAFAFRLAIAADGKIILAGTTSSPRSMVAVRLNTDGSVDSSFGSGGIFTQPSAYQASALAIQGDGKIVLAGVNASANALIAVRCLTNGALDPSFGNGGVVTITATNLNMSDAAIESDGRIICGGYYQQPMAPGQQTSSTKFALFRLLPNGALDPDFGNGGLVQTSFPENTQQIYTDSIGGIALQPDGQIVAAGSVTGNVNLFGFARYTVANKPAVTTTGADAVSSIGATLHGSAIPNFADTNVYFQYGPDTNYGTITALQDIGAGTSSIPFSSVLNGLNYSAAYHYRAVGVNSQGSALGGDAMFTTSGYDFGAFQQRYFSPAQLADPNFSGLSADPSHDGITNLMAYAFELSPLVSSVAQLPVAQLTNGYLTITYTQLHNPLDITYEVEVSSDLVNWNSGATYTTQVSVTRIDQLVDSLTVRDNVPATSGPRFMRVRITH